MTRSALPLIVDSARQDTALRGVVDVFVNEPTDMPWGNRSLLVRDPDGNLINFFTPISEAAPKELHVESEL